MKLRLVDYALHPLAIKRLHDALLESQYWTPARRRDWVQERLERTLRHAVKNVPYYRRTLGPYETRFTEMIDRLDLSELPVLSKQDVRAHFDELCADGISVSERDLVRTSGTTGTPARFLMDRESNLNHFASMWRVLNWAGYRFGDRFADFKADPGKRLPANYDARQNCLVFPVEHLKKDNVALYVGMLKAFRPSLIKSYPPTLNLVCRWMKELDIVGLHPKQVVCCAETLLDHHRVVIEDVMRCPIYDFYAQNERAALISTCEKERYHVHDEYSYLEFPCTGRLESENSAEIVATTFHNLAMPLIRYRTGDMVTLDDGAPCQCQRTYRTVRKIVGRVQDMVVTPDGLHLSTFEHAFLGSPGIRMSQIVQESTAGIEVRIVKAENYTEEDLEKVDAGVRRMIGDQMSVEYTFVDSIPAGENGKIPFVVSKPGSEAALRDPSAAEPMSVSEDSQRLSVRRPTA
jgi:phenylacetate-CoA ligase